MNPRLVRWAAALVVLGALDLVATIHAHLSFHHTPGGPTVMSLGQLLGWASSAMVLIAGIALVSTLIRDARRMRQQQHRPWSPPRRTHDNINRPHKTPPHGSPQRG